MSTQTQIPSLHPAIRCVSAADSLERRLHDLVIDAVAFGSDRHTGSDQDWWRQLAATGTRSWLDTGDMDEATELWCSSFAALTTNNTLLNKEVQKGIYDELIGEVAALTSELPEHQRIAEIAFVLNARHGLRLASRFGGRVSVELHTDCAHDTELSIAYGRRLYAICPEHFIIKVPLTTAGLLATRQLRADGIPVNFTLGFSARQNLLAAAYAAPSYVNVFLGRLNAYVKDNNLGDGINVGEKVTLASQRAVRSICAGRQVPTLQIAASMRNGLQVTELAGVDVHTMPPAAAREAQADAADVEDRSDFDPAVSITDDVELVEVLWTIGDQELALARSLETDPPLTLAELEQRFADHQLDCLFPALDDEEAKRLREDGKIPVHASWRERLTAGTASVDGLCSAAALAAFTGDQEALDERIRGLL